MLKLFITCLMVVSINSAMALELFSYKKGKSTVTYTKAQIETMWASDTPACLKDGSRILGVNKAYQKAKLRYSDCSASENAQRKQELTGVSVNLIKLTQLPAEVAKQVLGIK